MIAQIVGTVGKLAVVFVINVSLFLILPVTENLFKMLGNQEKQVVAAQKRLVAEYVKPREKQVEKPKQSRIRSVSNASSQPLQSTMKFKFTPDLALGGAGDGVAMQSQDLQAEVFEEGQVDVDAIPMNTPPPSYPKRAREMAIEGEAVAVFVVDVDGSVRQIEKIDAPHPIIAEEIRKTLLQWKFKAAQNRGVPVKTRVSVPFTFSLDS
jgi:TonB family protein